MIGFLKFKARISFSETDILDDNKRNGTITRKEKSQDIWTARNRKVHRDQIEEVMFLIIIKSINWLKNATKSPKLTFIKSNIENSLFLDIQ